jgi:glycosyltransferase involved in cell wall biosynthesis
MNKKKKVIVVGPVLTRSGYGEQARFALRALRSREDEYDIYIHPLNWGATGWLPEYDEEKAWIDAVIEKTVATRGQKEQPEYDISVQVTIPNEWKPIASYNVGYTAGMETTKIHPEWIVTSNQMDQIIVVSEHSKNVFENTQYAGTYDNGPNAGQEGVLKLEAPISVVNYPVKKFKNINLDLPELKNEINFLCVAQMSPRKNLGNLLNWFIQEFHDDEIGLVLKTNRSKNSLSDKVTTRSNLKSIISAYPDKRCSVYLLHGDMTDQEMHALYGHEKIKAFVSIPHGEGFGLPIFEAAYMNLPIVAPGWSGQCDFLFNKNKEQFYNVSFDLRPVQKEAVWDKVILEDSMWCWAREQSAKEQMRLCYNDVINNTGHVKNTKKYSQFLKKKFAEETMYNAFCESVDRNIPEEEREWLENLSKIEIV